MKDEKLTLSGRAFILHPSSFSLCRRRAGGSAEALEGAREFVCDLVGAAVLDLVAFEHVDELAAAEERDLRRGGRVGREVLARLDRRFDVRAGEDGDGAVGARLVLQRERDAGPRLARRAAADGIDDDHQRALRALYGVLDLFGRARLLDAEPRQVFAHGLDEKFGVRHLLSPSLKWSRG